MITLLRRHLLETRIHHFCKTSSGVVLKLRNPCSMPTLKLPVDAGVMITTEVFDHNYSHLNDNNGGIHSF